MSLALGLFDVFTYTIPGTVYLGLLMYVLARLGWVDLHVISGYNSTILIAAYLVLSYLLGHLGYAPRKLINDRLPSRLKGNHGNPRENLLAKAPTSRGRPFLDADRSILFAAVESKDEEAALEIARLRATGLMLRNTALPFALSAITALVELVPGPNRLLAACAAGTFASASILALRQGEKLSHWSTMKTLESAFCMPDIDDLVR